MLLPIWAILPEIILKRYISAIYEPIYYLVTCGLKSGIDFQTLFLTEFRFEFAPDGRIESLGDHLSKYNSRLFPVWAITGIKTLRCYNSAKYEPIHLGFAGTTYCIQFCDHFGPVT